MYTNRKVRVGKVVSDKMDKTVVVLVERLVQHPKYKKYYKKYSKFMAHDKDNSCSVGDIVEIVECRPLSRHKHWKVRRILEKAKIEEREVELNDTAPDSSESGG